MSQPSNVFAPIEPAPNSRPAPKPTARQWLLHTALFLITLCTTTICGIWMVGDLTGAGLNQPIPRVGGVGIPIVAGYVVTVARIVRFALLHPDVLAVGLKFSGALLAILTAHESGHYLFCRYYGVDATLPFFIPQPPLLIPGTFGAFIRMKSPVPSRRALFDIGLAGPLAGFVVLIPIAFAGVLTLKHQNIPPGSSGITFNDPLLFRAIAAAFKINLNDGMANSFYLAAWFGALVTALNLMPVGQLDGGHGTFSVFGKGAHRWIGQAAFVTMAIISVLGWFWHGSPSGFVYD